jgi:hypothetical protein
MSLSLIVFFFFLTKSNIEFTDLEIPLYRKRKVCNGSDSSHHNPTVKKRKFFDRVSGVTSDGGFSSESVSNSPEKGTDGHKPSSSSKLQVTEDSRGN